MNGTTGLPNNKGNVYVRLFQLINEKEMIQECCHFVIPYELMDIRMTSGCWHQKSEITRHFVLPTFLPEEWNLSC